MPIVKCYENNTIFYTYQSLPKFTKVFATTNTAISLKVWISFLWYEACALNLIFSYVLEMTLWCTYNDRGLLRVAECCFFAIWPVDARLVPRLLLRRNAVPMITSRSAFVIMDLRRVSLVRIFSLMLDIVEARLGETLDLLLDFLFINVLENPIL